MFQYDKDAIKKRQSRSNLRRLNYKRRFVASEESRTLFFISIATTSSEFAYWALTYIQFGMKNSFSSFLFGIIVLGKNTIIVFEIILKSYVIIELIISRLIALFSFFPNWECDWWDEFEAGIISQQGKT